MEALGGGLPIDTITPWIVLHSVQLPLRINKISQMTKIYTLSATIRQTETKLFDCFHV